MNLKHAIQKTLAALVVLVLILSAAACTKQDGAVQSKPATLAADQQTTHTLGDGHDHSGHSDAEGKAESHEGHKH